MELSKNALMEGPFQLTEKQAEAFLSRVKVAEGDACWEWSGAVRNAYGACNGYNNGKRRSLDTHRVAFFSTHPSADLCLSVLHKCDNPKCVRPSHLFSGTTLDNIKDAIRKGRNCRGEQSHHARLTVDQVRDIRRDYEAGKGSMKQVGQMYGISPPHVHKIVHRHKWAHVD